MGTVNSITTYIGPEVGMPVMPVSGLDHNDDGTLCQRFRDLLLPDRKPFKLTLHSHAAPSLNCNFLPCGETAGVAAWWFGQKLGLVEAVSVYLTGLDSQETKLVEIALATKPSEHSKPLPISLFHWHNVLELKPPILATFLLTPDSRTNRMIATAAPALANSLFSILGVG